LTPLHIKRPVPVIGGDAAIALTKPPVDGTMHGMWVFIASAIQRASESISAGALPEDSLR
jgi:hypothetical protein